MTDELKTKIKSVLDHYFTSPCDIAGDFTDTLEELDDAQNALRRIRDILKDDEPTEKPEPDAPSTEGLKLWRVTAKQVCFETIHVWANTLKEARDAVSDDLYGDGIVGWELNDILETYVDEGEPTDPDFDYEVKPGTLGIHSEYIVKDGRLADLD